MDRDKLTLSEVDRQLLSDLSCSDSESNFTVSDVFDDDSDADPLYLPEEVTQPRYFNRNTSNVGLSSDDEFLAQPSTSTRPTQTLPRPTQTLHRPSQRIDRRVISDTSDESDNGDVGNETWQTINEGDTNFTHNFSYYETPGPKHCPPVTASPIDYFNLFFTRALLDIFVLETNRYANQTIASKGQNISPQSRLHGWLPVNYFEIRAFIAVIINMGLIKKPTIASYWTVNNSQSTPWFRKMFTRNRFQAILQFFHIIDNTKFPKASEPGYDPTQKFQPVIDHCNSLFQRFYVGHQQLSIDESLIGTKSQTTLMQYLPNKHHHRWGIKLWVLCDSISNYCLSLFCYKGKNCQENREEIKEFGVSYYVVKKLLTMCNYLKKGYHLFTDNFFTSIPLVRMLYQNQTFHTGTIRKNKKGLPDAVKTQLNVGQKVYCKQNEILALSYRQKKSQKKPVILVSSHSDATEVECTKRRHGRVTTEKKPAMVSDYTKHMGGIDTFDMMLYAYLDERRTFKYWKKAVFNMFSRIVLNSYIIYKENKVQHGQNPISRYKFVVSIIDSITEEWRGVQQDTNVNNRKRTLEKLPGKKEKTCWVCTKSGPEYKNKGRKRSRTVCSQCGEGCHGVCFPKHTCK